MDPDHLSDALHERFDAKTAAREKALPAARRSIRASANAIRAVHRGEALLSPAATRALIGRFLSRPDTATTSHGRLECLTEREREVLGLVGSGLSNEEIATQLVLSAHTVKTHVNRTMTKLGAHDRAQLVIAAYETALVQPASRSRANGGV